MAITCRKIWQLEWSDNSYPYLITMRFPNGSLKAGYFSSEPILIWKTTVRYFSGTGILKDHNEGFMPFKEINPLIVRWLG